MVFAFFLTQYLVPKLSTHFSFKPALESYAKFAKPGEKIGRYHVEGHGSGFYGGERHHGRRADQEKLDGVPARCASGSSRWSRPTIWRRSTTGFKRGQGRLLVVDASSSRFLLISNRLARGRDRREPAAEGRLDGADAARGRTASGSRTRSRRGSGASPSRRRSPTRSSWWAPTTRQRCAGRARSRSTSIFRVKTRAARGLQDLRPLRRARPRRA